MTDSQVFSPALIAKMSAEERVEFDRILAAPAPNDPEDDKLEKLEKMAKEGYFVNEPGFALALALYRDELERAKKHPDFDPPPGWHPPNPWDGRTQKDRLHVWRFPWRHPNEPRGRFENLLDAWVRLHEIWKRVEGSQIRRTPS